MRDNIFEYLKNNTRTNNLDWLRTTPFVSYGYVTEVVSNTSVRVTPIVQDDPDFSTEFDVTLLSISSASYELSVAPQEKDLVLLLSLDKMHPLMFNDVDTRPETEDNPAGPVLHGHNNTGYTLNAMVGILARTARGAAALRTTVDDNSVSFACSADALFARLLGDVFVNVSAADDGVHKLEITVTPSHPTTLNQQAPLTASFGFQFNGDEDVPIDAGVTMKFSEKAPVTLTHEAPVEINLLEKASLTLNSEEDVTLILKKALKLMVDSSELVTVGNQVDTLGAMVAELIDLIVNLQTVGSPGAHTAGPKTIADASTLKAKWQKVFD